MMSKTRVVGGKMSSSSNSSTVIPIGLLSRWYEQIHIWQNKLVHGIRNAALDSMHISPPKLYFILCILSSPDK